MWSSHACKPCQEQKHSTFQQFSPIGIGLKLELNFPQNYWFKTSFKFALACAHTHAHTCVRAHTPISLESAAMFVSEELLLVMLRTPSLTHRITDFTSFRPRPALVLPIRRPCASCAEDNNNCLIFFPSLLTPLRSNAPPPHTPLSLIHALGMGRRERIRAAHSAALQRGLPRRAALEAQHVSGGVPGTGPAATMQLPSVGGLEVHDLARSARLRRPECA